MKKTEKMIEYTLLRFPWSTVHQMYKAIEPLVSEQELRIHAKELLDSVVSTAKKHQETCEWEEDRFKAWAFYENGKVIAVKLQFIWASQYTDREDVKYVKFDED